MRTVHPAAMIFPPLAGEAWARFLADVREHGQIEPIVVQGDVLLDGRNRLRACVELGVTPKAREWEGTGSAAAWILSTNLHRRHLDDSQRAMVGARAVEMFKEEARARMMAGSAAIDPPADLREASETPKHERTAAAEAAAVVNVSARSVEHAMVVVAKGAPELVEAVQSGAVAVSTASDIAGALTSEEQTEIVARGPKQILAMAKEIRAKRIEIRRDVRLEKIATIARGNAPMGTVAERYPILYADPPWRYELGPDFAGAAEGHYPTMTVDEIGALPVPGICTPDCMLFLWTTSPKLGEAFDVLKAWGFTYRTSAVWVKDRAGLGHYFRQRHELLLVAARGTVITPLPGDRRDSVFEIAKGEHSAKPAEVAEWIERAYPTLPKIELFARAARPDWAVWGNQAHAGAA